MTSYDDGPETVEMTLTQREGRHLLAFLESAGGNGSDRPCPPTLQAIDEKIDDATALAGWLREHVRLELDSAEAADLFQALPEQAGGQGHLSEDEKSALAAVRDKLSGCLPNVLDKKGKLEGGIRLTRL